MNKKCASFVLAIFLVTLSLNAKECKVRKENSSKINSWEFQFFFPEFIEGLLREDRSASTYRKFFDKKKQTFAFEQRRAQLSLLKNCYDQVVTHIQKNAQKYDPKIPRIVHQIWLGSPVPKKFKDWMETWANWQGWEYKLWTDEDVAAIQLINQEAYDKAVNYGEKSDILRLEILYLVGGLYVDVDFKCIASSLFDLLHNTTDLYMGIEPIEHELLRFGNSLMGSIPGHPLLAKLIGELSRNCEKMPRNNTIDRTGPRYITRVIYDYLENQENGSEVNLFMPSVTFFPYNGYEFLDKDVNAFPPLKGTAAIHYWTGSWAVPTCLKKRKT